MADHEAAWAKGLAQEQAHQRELLATFRGELGAFARECAATLSALDGFVGPLGDVVSAIEAGTQAHQHGKLVLDLSRRFKQLAPGADPEEAELYAGFEGEGNISDRAVGHARRLLEGDPKRSDRELLKAVAAAAGVRARVEDLLGPAPVAALAALSPLARRLPGVATVEEREAETARKSLTSVLNAVGTSGEGDLVDVASAAALADSMREAATHAGASVKAVEEGRLKQVIAEARKQLHSDLEELRAVHRDAEGAPSEWLDARKQDIEALAEEIEAKLDRLERVGAWLNGLLPRLQLVSRGLGTAEKAQTLENRLDPRQPVAAEAARLSVLLDLATVWGPLLGRGGRAGGRAGTADVGRGLGRMRPAAADFGGPRRRRILGVAALVALLGAGAGIGAWVASSGGGGSKAAPSSSTAGSSSTATTTMSEPGPLTMRLYPVDDFLILQWMNTGTVPVVEFTVDPQGFEVVSGSDCQRVSSARTTSGLQSHAVLLCKKDIQPGPEPSSIRIDTKPPGATGSVLVTYKDSKGKTYGPTEVDLTKEETTSSTTSSTSESFAANSVYDGCIAIEPQGSTTVLSARFTVSNPQTGPYRAAFARGPTGRLSGSGTATAGGNLIVVPMRATAFGTYDQLSIVAPDGKPVQLGPLQGELPLELNASTDKPNACNTSALRAPPTSGPPPTQSMSRAQAAQAYLAAVAPVNSAVGAFNRKAQRWASSTTAAQALTDARPLISAFRSVLPQLAGIAGSYPPAAAGLQAGIRAAVSVAGDLVALTRLSSIGVSAWRSAFVRDTAKLAAASKRVRRVLGLPPIGG